MKLRGLTGLAALILWSTFLFYTGCTSGDEPQPVDCATSNLALAFTATDPTSCTVNDGKITATVSGGQGPFQYALDTDAYGSNANFTGLGAGTYQLKLKDANGCERSTSVVLKPFGSTLSAIITTTKSGCKTNDGSIIINATGGSGPYTYQINTGAATSNSTVPALAAGSYAVKVTDNTGCSITQTVRVMSGIRLSVEVKAIIDANCAVTGCHVSGGAAVSFTMIDNIIANAGDIKAKTQSGEMPKGGPALSTEKLNTIACWVDDGAPNN